MTAKEDREREKTSREMLGKYFFDMSKAIFTTMVATSLINLILSPDDDYSALSIALSGTLVSSIFAYIGYIIVKRK